MGKVSTSTVRSIDSAASAQHDDIRQALVELMLEEHMSPTGSPWGNLDEAALEAGERLAGFLQALRTLLPVDIISVLQQQARNQVSIRCQEEACWMEWNQRQMAIPTQTYPIGDEPREELMAFSRYLWQDVIDSINEGWLYWNTIAMQP